MAPKRTLTSAAPAMTQAAIKKLVADSVFAALEAQAATMANFENTNRNTGQRETHVARKCSYREFMSCQPFNLKGTKGAVGLIHWFERTELVFLRSNCTEDCKVKFATGTLTEEALSWWNSFTQPIGIEEAYKIPWSLRSGTARKTGPVHWIANLQASVSNLVIALGREINNIKKFECSKANNIATLLNFAQFLGTFIDDILIYSRNKEEHADHLRIILELLKKDKLYAKFSKCDFWISTVQFLGHVINCQGIHVDLAKIEAVKNWASPTTPTEVRQFLGLAGYYRRFIEAPILALPEGNNDFVVYYDASLQGLGACIVFTDHKRLQHILDQKELNMRQRRWLKLLIDYDYEIRYHPRNANVVADALSQKERIKTLRVRALVMTLHLKLPSQILEAQTEAIKEENIEAENL
ncbi:putative reverse transcriptase domain-containing protein [Tanacetum coccineum]